MIITHCSLLCVINILIVTQFQSRGVEISGDNVQGMTGKNFRRCLSCFEWRNSGALLVQCNARVCSCIVSSL